MRKPEDFILSAGQMPVSDIVLDSTHYRGTGHIRTFTGRMVDPFNLKISDVHPADCVHSLSQINRFTGHALRPYSVGEHSLHLYNAVPKKLRKAALIHDWTEAYFNDIARPVKQRMETYKADEKKAAKVIFDTMGVRWVDHDELDPYDKDICTNEMAELFEPSFKHYRDALPGVIIGKEDVNWKEIRNEFAWVVMHEFRWLDKSAFERFNLK